MQKVVGSELNKYAWPDLTRFSKKKKKKNKKRKIKIFPPLFLGQ